MISMNNINGQVLSGDCSAHAFGHCEWRHDHDVIGPCVAPGGRFEYG